MLGQADQLQQLAGAALALRGIDLAQRHAVGHVVRHRQMRKQGIALEHHADAAPVHRRARQILSIQQDAARMPGLQAGHQLEQGGFAGAAGADHGQQLTRVDLHRNAMHALPGPWITIIDGVKDQAHWDPRRRKDDSKAATLARISSTTVAAQANPVAP